MKNDPSLQQALKTVLISSVVTVAIIIWHEIIGQTLFIAIVGIALLVILFG